MTSWTHFSGFSVPKNGTVFWPPKRGHFTSLASFPNWQAERRGRKMDPFLGGSVCRAAVQRSLQDEWMSDDDPPVPLRSDDSEE